ncbi:MAG: CoA-substrate-specific enzyme activase [Acidobacteria bacterium]|nr:CoA-substrate-specific enzyme activase [Acidobacteriota bacterium]
MAIHIGIDLGSVSVKAALFSRDAGDAPFFERHASHPLFQSVRRLTAPAQGSSWLAVTRYARIAGNPLKQTRELLENLVSLVDRSSLGEVAGTGRGAKLLQSEFGMGNQNEFRALCKAVELLCPGVHTLFEMGGENSKYIRFDCHGSDGRLGIADYQTNGDCAAGTGGFLDQQAGRLLFKVEEIGDLVLATQRAAQIAGRCSVFAKSDMIHAQQKGFTPEEILKGLCDAVARNFKSAITKGKKIVPEICFVGGVASNRGVVQALESEFGWDPGTLKVPGDHTAFGAIGSALLAAEISGEESREQHAFSLERSAEAEQIPSSPRLSMDNVVLLRNRMVALSPEEIQGVREAFLGIDIGSVSTNLVVIDADCNVLKEIYLRTDGRPIEVVGRGLREIEQDLAGKIHICGVGTTGSGRELIGELVGADTVNDEITAHKTGAAFIDRTILGLGVDTIFEIGGQDAKFISLEEGIVVDFAMNEACAAGTGSFLEERAKELGIRIENDFARIALSSDDPIRLGERCTVFMERDVNGYLQRGASLDRIVGGLAYSVATNYINRVVRGRKIGEVIFFQGGTAYNDAVAAAFSSILGKRIIVPPFNGVIGALGVALLAKDKMLSNRQESTFRGFDLDKVDYDILEFTCKGCTNFCQMQRFTVEGEQTYWGDKCSERYRKAVRSEHEPVIENLIEFRRNLLLADYRPEAGDGPVVGFPFCMSTYDWAPFWLNLMNELGIRVLLSEPTTNQIVKLGLESVVSEPCFPIQVAHGHVRWLIDKKVDNILVPNYIAAPGDKAGKPSFFCPWNQTLPFITRVAPFISEYRQRILAPTLWFNHGVRAVAREIREALHGAGMPRSARQVELAVERGFAASSAFRNELLRAGAAALAAIAANSEHGIVLLGRPYNIYDKGVNLDIGTKMRKYYGANVLGLDFLDIDESRIEQHHENMYWSYGGKILAAAAFVKDKPHLHIVYITNFKCGPDSYIKHFITEVSGRPFLTLQFDGHNNDAGMLTRCEAYLDSKGVLRRWGSTEREMPAGKSHP